MCVRKAHRKASTRGVAHSAWAEVAKTVNTHRENGRAWHINLIVCVFGSVCVCVCASLHLCFMCFYIVNTSVCVFYVGDSYSMWCDHEVVR